VWCDGESEPTRVRAGYPTDTDIADTVERYTPNAEGPGATAEAA
jgi:hypothetical protein